MSKRAYIRTDGGMGKNKDTHINKIRNNLKVDDLVFVDGEEGVVLDIKYCDEQKTLSSTQWKKG